MNVPASLHKQLLAQARHLASKEPKKPQQASLRRAVSAAYYALFHFLIEEAGRALLGNEATGGPLRATLARAFKHQEMAKTSRAFRSSPLGDDLFKGAVRGTPLPPDLVKVAGTFADLQEKRHEADYDLSVQFRRQDVTALIDQVDQAVASWTRVRNHPAARLYLLTMLYWERMNRNLH